MTFTEAAEAVLRKVGKPLHYKKITQMAIEQNLLSHVGKTPEVTMSTRLATLAKKDRGEAPIVRVKPGVFGLRDWGDAAVAAAGDEPDDDEVTDANEGEGSERETRASEPHETTPVVRSPEETERAERLVAAAQLFPAEDDDDMPVMAERPVPPAPVDAAATPGGAAAADGRRRRRRRRRGRGGERPEGGVSATGELPLGTEAGADGDDLEEGDEFEGDDGGEEAAPGVAAEGADGTTGEGAPAGDVPLARTQEPRREGRRDERGHDRNAERGEHRRDDRRDEQRRGSANNGASSEDGRDPAGRLEESGRDAADLVVSLLSRRDDRQPVAVRALVDDGLRNGKLTGDPNLLIPALSAAARMDGVRRAARGERPRMRVANGRVGLVDWALGPELVRAESDALAALERLRDAARRQVIRRLNELPQSAFTELVVLLLEKLGISNLRNTRRPGLPQGEIHLAGIARRANEELKVAVLIKRGGEIGRERVIELRGSLHHYGPATSAWIVTTGNVLSGARDEAAQAGTDPVNLIDGGGLGRLLDENGVGVSHAQVQIPYLDLDLFDALRSS